MAKYPNLFSQFRLGGTFLKNRIIMPAMDTTITLSGGGWIDVTDIGATKGIAYEKLCEYLEIDRNETMMFGDYLNDYEMLKRCPDSWCMKNGHPEVKKICAHITEYTNDEDGVAKELERGFSEIICN